MIFPGIERVVSLTALLYLLVAAPVCEESMAGEVIASRAAPDQVLVLYNVDWNEDSERSGKGQDSRELAEYYQAMHTDPETGKKPFLLPLTCVHGDKHLNDWFIKEESTDNKNAIAFTGPGDPPKDFNWVLDSRHVEIIVPEKNTDWDSVSIRIHSETSDATKTIYMRQQAIEGMVVSVSGLPKSQGFARTYPPVKAGEGRCFRFDITQVTKGTANVSLTASDKEGRDVADLSVRYFDREEFVFSATGQDGIPDDKHLEEDVLQPVRNFLDSPEYALPNGRLLKDHILYIVIVHGMPYAANGIFGIEHGATSNKDDQGSLTSLEQRLQTLYYPWGSKKMQPPLTAVYLTKGPQEASGVSSHIVTTFLRYPLTGVRWNPYLHPDVYSYLNRENKTPPTFFPVASLAERRQRLTNNFHAFAVTRIDGPTLEDAKRIVDNTLYANRYLRPEMDCAVRKRLQDEGLEDISDLPERMKAATKENLWGGSELQKIGFRVDSGAGLPFLVMPPGAAAGECGVDKSSWKDTGFYPGGMHHQVDSSNGLNFKNAEVWQMLGQGATVTAAGSPAYSGGPHITNTTFWDNRIVMRYLLHGKDLGEALLLSNLHINWSTSYLGDPLLHPDLRETVIDKTPPTVSGQKVTITLTRNEETFAASFAATLVHNPEAPEVAVMRVECKDDDGVESKGYSNLFSRRPTVSIPGLAPEKKFQCSVTFADPYENLTTSPIVNFTTPKITMIDKFTRGVVDIFKGIKIVPRR
jgi:hypothetical protein